MPRNRTVVRRAGVQHVVPVQAKVVDRIDPSEDFSDVNGSDVAQFKLENERSDRKYVWPTDTMEDRQRFQSGQVGVRYKAETYEGDDVPTALRPVGALGMFQKGDTIRIGPHVLMSCDRALWEKRQRFEATQTQQGRKFAAAHRSEGRDANYYAQQHNASGWQGLDKVNSAVQEQE